MKDVKAGDMFFSRDFTMTRQETLIWRGDYVWRLEQEVQSAMFGHWGRVPYLAPCHQAILQTKRPRCGNFRGASRSLSQGLEVGSAHSNAELSGCACFSVGGADQCRETGL